MGELACHKELAGETAAFRHAVQAVSWWGIWEPHRALSSVVMTVAKHRAADASRVSPRRERGRDLCLQILQTLLISVNP